MNNTSASSKLANGTQNQGNSESPSLVRGLSLLDSILLVVGGIIGSAIFLIPRDLARELPSASAFLLVWIVGGIAMLIFYFASAELGAMYPEAGGHYIYLREAFGDLVGFLYGWMLFSVNNTGGVAAISVAFAYYFGVLVPAAGDQHVIWRFGHWAFTRAHIVALATMVGLTWINIIGLRRASKLLNVATFLKFLAMAAFIVLGLMSRHGSWSNFRSAGAQMPVSHSAMLSAFGVALIAVFWAYDGGQYICWAAGEVKDPERTLPRSLIIGMAAVAAVYILMNVVYLYALPLPAIAAGEQTTARTAAEILLRPGAGLWMAGLIAISCLGAISSAVLAGARVFYAMAHDGLFFHTMAAVHPRFRTPHHSLIAQGAWSAVLIVSGSYDQLFTYLTFMGVMSYIATVLALFVLRRKRPNLTRPYRCTGYPWLPAIFLIAAVAWAVNTLWQRPAETLAGALIVLAGVPLYVYWRRKLGCVAAQRSIAQS